MNIPEIKKHKAREYKLAIEAVAALQPHARFSIKSKGGGFGRCMWEIKTMDKIFSGYDFIECVRKAVIFAAKANDVLTKDELEKLIHSEQEEN